MASSPHKRAPASVPVLKPGSGTWYANARKEVQVGKVRGSEKQWLKGRQRSSSWPTRGARSPSRRPRRQNCQKQSFRIISRLVQPAHC